MVFHRSLAAVLAVFLTTPVSAGSLQGANLPRAGAGHPAPPPAKSVSYAAVVAADGTLVRGIGATAAMQAEGSGTYEVDFISDVSACAFVATVGQPGSSGAQPAGYITVVGRNGNPAGIYIVTRGLDGNVANLPFHVDVGC